MIIIGEEVFDQFGKEVSGNFVSAVHVIEELYSKLIFRKVKTDKISRLVFKFLPLSCEPPTFAPPQIAYSWPFDFGKFGQASPCMRKRMILDAAKEAVIWFACRSQWELPPLEEAYQAALDCGLILRGTSKKSWMSPDKKHRVRVRFEYDWDRILLFAVLTPIRSQRVLADVPLGTARPGNDVLRYYLADGTWPSNSSFVLCADTFIREKWLADFSNIIAAQNFSEHGK